MSENQYKEYFEKIKEFKKQLESEDGIEKEDKKVIEKIFIENLFRSDYKQPVPEPFSSKSQPEKDESLASDCDETFAGMVNKTKFNQHPDLVLLSVYYQIKKGNKSVTISEIDELYKSAYLKRSSNTRMFVNVNLKKGNLMEGESKDGKTACTITRQGINYIEEALKNATPN